MVRRREGSHFDLRDSERGVQDDARAFSVNLLEEGEKLATESDKMSRWMYQSLHHLSQRLEAKVEIQVDTRESLGGHEQLQELSLDRRSDLVNHIQEALNLERRLRIGRTIMDLNKA
jgi:uncharacterized protein YgfB (UPF0149 family)